MGGGTSRGTFHFHYFKESFFLENLQKSRENGSGFRNDWGINPASMSETLKTTTQDLVRNKSCALGEDFREPFYV